MATKAEQIAKVLRATMVAYVNLRMARGRTRVRRREATTLEREIIPGSGIKLRIHLGNNEE